MNSKQDNATWTSISLRLALNTASHPFEYAKVLIQIGYEPLSPYPTRTLFRKPALGLPNVVEYVKYIKKVDGFSGCYRGLSSRLVGNSLNLITSNAVSNYAKQCSHKYFSKFINDLPDDQLSETDKWLRLGQDTIIEIVGKTVALAVSYPFQVITIRMMAEFVGGEQQYNGIFSSVARIYKFDGILGFFAGFVPRLLAEILLISFVNVAVFLTHKVITDPEIDKFSSIPIAIAGTAYTYPFHVVSSCMSVNDCGLSAGCPPQMPIYSSWIDCWSNLSRNDQLTRGSSMFFRYYKGGNVSATNYHSFLIKKNY